MNSKAATLYRMVTDKHICPFGIKSKYLLKKKGFKIDDNHLNTRSETDEFKRKQNVKTTPQTFIDGKRIGGYDDLLEHFGIANKSQSKVTYTPVLSIFATTAAMATALYFNQDQTIDLTRVIELFIALTMVVLAVQKNKDLSSFSNQFITYDLIGREWVPYAYIYPFIEVSAGIAMLAMFLPPVFSILSIFIGSVGAVSVIKAVYIDKRELKCACVGGNSNVPLGFISLSENLAMFGMGVWMLLK